MKTIIVAEYDSVCPITGQEIIEGQTKIIRYKGQWVHVDVLEQIAKDQDNAESD